MIIKLNNSWLLFSLGTLLFWGGWSFLPKIALQILSPDGLLFYEAVGGLLASLPVLFFLNGKLEKDRKGIIITACTSSLNIVAILAYFYALRLGPVATIVTMTAMYPVITLALARIFLRERMNRLQLLATTMALAAIVLLAG
ncbi:MAG: DMT family transporter [Proteobacteria bacterium]|nr:DMT family transporter [Pseudomonadota bacterium]